MVIAARANWPNLIDFLRTKTASIALNRGFRERPTNSTLLVEAHHNDQHSTSSKPSSTDRFLLLLMIRLRDSSSMIMNFYCGHCS